MSDCIDPNLVAYADQRIATCGTFLDRMIVNERSDTALRGPGDALAVCALSAALDSHLTHRSALTDALALAIRRLAATPQWCNVCGTFHRDLVVAAECARMVAEGDTGSWHNG